MRSNSWRYGAFGDGTDVGGRDLRLDLLRGLCLLKMVMSHYWTSPLDFLHRSVGYVSAAGAFFFISGVVVGIVHGRRVERLGLAATSRLLLTRAFQLYLANVALAFLFLSLELRGFLAGSSFDVFAGERFLGWRLLAFDQPYYLEILPRYVVFLALAPAALWCLSRGRTLWLLAVCGGLWAWHQVPGAPALLLPFFEREGAHFPVATWQVLFLGGMVCGYHREALGRAWRHFESRRGAVAGLFLAFGAFAALRLAVEARLLGSLWGPTLIQALEWLFSREWLGPGRMVNLVVGFAVFFWLTDRLWRPVARWTGPLLLPLGQNALYAFLLHVPLGLLANGVLERLEVPMLPGSWAGLAVNLLLLSLLWAVTRYRLLFALVPR